MAIKGLFKKGDHILVSSMEHNAVMRPLVQMEKEGLTFDRLPCRSDGSLILESLGNFVKENTKAVIMTHASNVCGTVMPLKEVGPFVANTACFSSSTRHKQPVRYLSI